MTRPRSLFLTGCGQARVQRDRQTISNTAFLWRRIRRAAKAAEADRYKGAPSPVAPLIFDFFASYPTVQGFAPDVAFRQTTDASVKRLKAIYAARNYRKIKRSPISIAAAADLLTMIAEMTDGAATFAALLDGGALDEEPLEKTLIWLLKYDLIGTCDAI